MQMMPPMTSLCSCDIFLYISNIFPIMVKYIYIYSFIICILYGNEQVCGEIPSHTDTPIETMRADLDDI